LLAVGITAFGYVLVQLPEKSNIPVDLWFFVSIFIGLYVLAHLAIRQLAPYADPSLLPLAAFLNGIGFVTISRLDPDLARTQVGWMAAGVGAFVATLVVVRRIRTLERFRYSFLLLGLLALLLPLVPGIGKTINGARLWVGIGPMNFQPGEAAKVLLVIFFAAYLVDKRELLASGTRRLGRLVLPDPKHLAPLLLAWAVSILVMVQQKDLGSSLLFFAVFGAMLYAATERGAYLLTALVLFLGGAAIAHNLFSHVQDRVTTWLNPWDDAQGKGFQVVQSWFSFGTGFRIALEADRPFPKLFAAGLTVIMGIQAFVIIGGVTRVIPLTGITLPFISYGGSSLVANFVVLALLLRISDDNARARSGGRRGRATAPVTS
jgi:peptidoglycan glycosyltransferase